MPGTHQNGAGRQRILVVDGDRVSRLVLTRWLTKRMPEVEIADASDGAAAVEHATDDCPDVILMELGLAEIDGPELIRRVRALGGGERTVIIAVTARAMPGDREKALAAGCDDYVTKPAAPQLVEEKVRSWLRQGRRPRG
jgi:two-component system cell cycle response regulator DivK